MRTPRDLARYVSLALIDLAGLTYSHVPVVKFAAMVSLCTLVALLPLSCARWLLDEVDDHDLADEE